MNDQHDDPEDQVSRLLAAAALPAETQLPEDVARRLDDVLAGLVAEHTPSADGPVPRDEVTGVTQLDPHRRRRRWPQLLVAAAAVSVLGIGVGNLLGDAQLEAGSASSADAARGGEPEGGVIAEGGDTAQNGSRAEADKPADSGSPGEQVAPEVQRDSDPTALSERPLPPRLRTSSLTVDLQRIEAFSLAVPVSETPGRWSRACVQPRTGQGDEWLPVRLDGERAVLVLREPTGGRRTADVFTCDDATDPAASTTLDAQ